MVGIRTRVRSRSIGLWQRGLVAACGLVLVYAIGASTASAAPTIRSVDPNSTSVPQYAKLELTLSIDAQFQNPYDQGDVHVIADFVGPDGHTVRVDGFRNRPFTTTPAGQVVPGGMPVWTVRFSPSAQGAWTYRVSCTDKTGTTQSDSQSFACTPAAGRGFVRTANEGGLFFDDGHRFFPVGENIGWWSTDPIGDYRRWIDRLSAHGGNYIRVWMATWSFSPEWTDTGLGNYDNRQARAHELDDLFAYAESKGVYVQLCLLNHGQFSKEVNPEWPGNPYSTTNGGPCQNPWDFFTNPTAKALIKQRFDYIVARWGHSPALLSWELFNEVDLTEQYADRRADNAAWHREMAAFLKQIDPNHHLVTTSYAGFPGDASVWADANIDYVQIHHYDTADDQSYVLASLTESQIAATRKPVIIGEFGFPDEIFSKQNDPAGVNLHNSLWASAFSGALGAASTWWWDNYVDPNYLYGHFRPVARAIERAVSSSEPLASGTATVRTESRADLAIAPGLTDFARAPENAFAIEPDGTLSPSAANLGRFLYAAQYHPELFNPPTFTFDAPQPGRFSVRTGADTGMSPTIVIYVDGQKVLDMPAKPSKVYSIAFGAGSHSILVTNLGVDWITIDQIALSEFLPGVRALVLRHTSGVSGWVSNRGYTWRAVRGTAPAAVTDAVVSLDSLRDGPYRLVWRSGDTGDVLSRSQVSATGGTVDAAVPALVWDASFDLTSLVPGEDIEPPVVSAVTLSKSKVRRSADANVDVTWQATDAAGIASFDVEFAEDGRHFARVVGGLSADTRTVRWTVPAWVPSSKQGAVRVVGFDAAGNEGVSAAVRLRVK